MPHSYSTRITFLVLILFFYSSCFGGGLDKRGSVKKYRDGIVYTGGGQFRVGKLPSSWARKSFNYRAILFEHTSLNATISVDSFCKGSFDDGPLNTLTNQLFYGMTEQKKKFSRPVKMSGREALRTAITGKIDGAPITMDVVVVKMNVCVFDFAYISAPEDYSLGVHDFETFYEGFQYLKGPEID